MKQVKQGFGAAIGVSILAHLAVLAVAPQSRPPQLRVRSDRISVSIRSLEIPAPPVSEVNQATPAREVVREPSAAPEPKAKTRPVAPKKVAKTATPTSAAAVDEALARVVDTEPVPWSRNRPPLYPQSAQKAGQQGTVLLKLLVLSSGKVGEVTTLRSSGFNILDDAARNAASRYRFKPASRAGKAVEYHATIPFEFELPRHSRQQ